MSSLDQWCRSCGSLHSSGDMCPVAVPTCGPERHSWRAQVRTRHGIESIGILVAPVKGAWRARIVSYPDEFWTVSRGTGVLKFFAASPQQAEGDAVQYIQEFLKEAGLEMVETGAASGKDEARSSPARGSSVHQSKSGGNGLDDLGMENKCCRKLCEWQVRFGHNALTREAALVNASERGLFIDTDNPLESGSVIRLELNAAGTTIPLRGTVVWVRVSQASGRPIGMGLRLTRPPAMYLDSVKKLG
jgi:hypothetical protein